MQSPFPAYDPEKDGTVLSYNMLTKSYGLVVTNKHNLFLAFKGQNVNEYDITDLEFKKAELSSATKLGQFYDGVIVYFENEKEGEEGNWVLWYIDLSIGGQYKNKVFTLGEHATFTDVHALSYGEDLLFFAAVKDTSIINVYKTEANFEKFSEKPEKIVNSINAETFQI